jgi:DNA polymerase-3 subunit alpha
MNSFLYLKVSCRPSWNKTDVRISFTNVQLLSSILEQFTKKLTINLLNNDVTEKNILKINNVLKDYEGQKPIQFTIFEPKENLKLTMPSRSFKVNISNELLEKLKKEQIHFKLN